jgi:hypothetical protein
MLKLCIVSEEMKKQLLSSCSNLIFFCPFSPNSSMQNAIFFRGKKIKLRRESISVAKYKKVLSIGDVSKK